MAVAIGRRAMIDVSISLALCALLIYGFTQVISKYIVRSLNATSMVAVNFVVSLPIYVVFMVSAVVIRSDMAIRIEYFVFGLIGASTARGGYFIFLEALERGAVTMVGSITAAYPAITVVLAVTVLGEELQPVNAIGISMIIISMIGLSLSHGRSSGSSGFSRVALLLSIATLLLWGVGGIFIKAALSELPLVMYLGLYPLILPPIAFAYLRHKRATRAIFFPKWSVPVIGAVVVAEVWQLGYFSETAAVSEGAASIVFPLISAYPIVTIAAARFFLKERLSKADWLLLVAVILGIVLTSAV